MRAGHQTPSIVAFALAGMAGALVYSQAPPAEIPKGPNVVFGRVLDWGSDTSVAGAVVVITGYFDPSGRATGASSRSVITNGDGYFFFRKLPAAKYTITSSAFGYISSATVRSS